LRSSQNITIRHPQGGEKVARKHQVTLKSLEDQVEFYHRLKGVLSREPVNFTEAIFLKYIELRRTSDVAAWLNAKGSKIESTRGFRLWISTDVTELLDDPAAVEFVDNQIYCLAKRMQKSGRLSLKQLQQVFGMEEIVDETN